MSVGKYIDVDMRELRRMLNEMRREAIAERDSIVKGVKIHLEKHAENASPRLSGYLAESWDVSVKVSNSNLSSNGNFSPDKSNTVTISVKVTNKAPYTKFLRKEYHQRGLQLLLARIRPDGKLNVLMVKNLPLEDRSKKRVNRKRVDIKDGVVTLITHLNKEIRPASKLAEALKWRKRLEGRAHKYIVQRLYRSKYFVGVVETNYTSTLR